jgi:hypothetical protein
MRLESAAMAIEVAARLGLLDWFPARLVGLAQ